MTNIDLSTDMDTNIVHGHKYRPKYRHGHKYSKYKKSVSMMMVLCIKHCLSSIDAQFIKKG